ncbi:MAG: 4Fe-4S binding protein [Eggerthellaceae bacterium]|nr:4Fe-4S binding protein [Eggerthellaceae bacterium]
MNKMRYARVACALAVVAALCLCTQVDAATGTLCVLCPVGFLEISLSSGEVPWGLLPGVAALLAVVFALGRVFCSWICPTSLVRNVFGGRAPRGLTGRTGETAAEEDHSGGNAALETGADPESAEDKGDGERKSRREGESAPRREGSSLVAQGVVLAMLLAVSFIVHFPVFCLICPIGLAMGTAFAASRTFMTWQPEWELVAFPALLLVEALLLRRWCSYVCPLGFFFGLMRKAQSRLHLPTLPRLRTPSCKAHEGCRACERVCPENIHVPAASAHDLQDCTLCLDCVEHCPAHALGFSTKTPREEGSSERADNAGERV